MRKITIGTLALLVVATLAWAGDVWKSKPMNQWSEKDVNDILQNSPWAKPNVSSQGAWRPDGMTQASGSGGTAGTKTDISKNASGATTDTMGGTEKEDEAAAAAESYNVFWWSSRTIRGASLRRAVLKGSMKEEDADKMLANNPEDYEVLVNSQNMQIFKRRGEDAFDKAAWLQFKKTKEKLFPTKVEFLKSNEGAVTGVIFHFPRKGANGEPTIAADEKEVDFYLLIGGSKILTAFDPRKMVDSQGEDL
jgi:hypothetical protein